MRRHGFRSLGLHGFHHIAYTEWGNPANPNVLVCVHGLTRCGRDFDSLAAALADKWRVVCPDLPGRGDSEWLAVKSGYVPPTYCADMASLIARLGTETVVWFGTSLGGIVGTALAAQPGTPLRGLAVNDIGPFVPGSGLQRIATLVGTDPRFATLAEAEAYIRKAMATFGVTKAEDWRHLTAISTRPDAGGGYRLHYDPGIAEAFRGTAYEDIDFWSLWDQVTCPTLAIRGESSDILSPEVAVLMTKRGPKAKLVEFQGCGHAPALLDAGQIASVRDWLDGLWLPG